MSAYNDGLDIDRAELNLERRRYSQGNDHLDTLLTMVELSLLYRELARYLEAKELLEEAILGFKNTLGDENYETERAESFLATVYFYLADYDHAKQIQERILENWGRKYLLDSAEVKSARENFELTLRKMGDYETLSQLEEQLVGDLAHYLGEDHLETLKAISYLAATKRSMNDFRLAKMLDLIVLERAERSNAGLTQILGIKRNLVDDSIGLKEWKEIAELLTQIYESAKLLPVDDEFRKLLEGKDAKYGYKLLRLATRKSSKSKK